MPFDDRRAGFDGYGSFHFHYHIDGRLVAVGVCDVLPSGVSSKYFFWDPAYRALSLGKVSALFEIAWIRKHAECCAELRALEYYYLGYYIHSCEKMRYKASFAPSSLLCSSTLRWRAFDDALRRRLDEGRVAALFDEGGGGRPRAPARAPAASTTSSCTSR